MNLLRPPVFLVLFANLLYSWMCSDYGGQAEHLSQAATGKAWSIQSDEPPEKTHTFCVLSLKTETEAKLLARPHACAVIKPVLVQCNVSDCAKTEGLNRWIILTMTRCLGWEGRGLWYLSSLTPELWDVEPETHQQTESAETPDRIISVFMKVKIHIAAYTVLYMDPLHVFYIFEGCRLIFFFFSSLSLSGLNRLWKTTVM